VYIHAICQCIVTFLLKVKSFLEKIGIVFAPNMTEHKR
jgi:hypothetical protein